MVGAILIIAVVLIIGILWYYNYTPNRGVDSNSKSQKEEKIDLEDSWKENSEIGNEIFEDKDGKRYRILNKIIEIPRKTYLRGRLTGKYWGEIDINRTFEFQSQSFYDFNIYEGEITIANETDLSPIPFNFTPDETFPRERLPQTIPCIVTIDGTRKTYQVVLYEPLLSGITFVRKYHQNDGDEVFGTVTADITGYILDFIYKEEEERIYVQDATTISANKSPNKGTTQTVEQTNTKTGRVEQNGNYTRDEYFYSDYKTKYWGKWYYSKRDNTNYFDGCMSALMGLLGFIFIGFIFLFALPNIGILIAVVAVPFLLNFLPSRLVYVFFRLMAFMLLGVFVFSILATLADFGQSSSRKVSTSNETTEERRVVREPFRDSTNSARFSDTVITHFRKWKDYESNEYQGAFSVKQSEFYKSGKYKNGLPITGNTPDQYDEIIYSLKEHDKGMLSGVYMLFDSIQISRKLSRKQFAEMVVSFVQDIPYSLVLAKGCDPALYNDAFIQKYLTSPNASCVGFEKYGINTPLQFLTTLKGDCDTRTLLLYTLLTHYGYDVVLLSSEYYSHSLLGIALRYSGSSYNLNGKQYTVWETTTPGVPPGILSREISNMYYWRISLKSK